MTAGLEPYWLGPDDGEALWVLGGLYMWKALGARTGGEYSLCEVRGPAGFAAPLHSHERENEGFYVASGEVTLVLAEGETRLVEGGFGFAPAGAPHTFRLDSPEAKLLLLITPATVAAASIVAKVVLDQMMVDLDRQFPQWGFAGNNGYRGNDGKHAAALAAHGPSPIHRLSSKGVQRALQGWKE